MFAKRTLQSTTSSQVGLRFALLSEEGGSEADGWCLGFRTAPVGGRHPQSLRTVACGRETPSVTCGDSSLGEGAFGFVQISDIVL